MLSYEFETTAIHGIRNIGAPNEKWSSCINMASTFPLNEFGATQEFEYSRVSNPTRKEFETLIAKLESGKHGFGFSSGMAATTSLFTISRQVTTLFLDWTSTEGLSVS